MKNIFIPIIITLVYFLLTSCSADSDGNSDVDGQGGSMARFKIAGDYLYTVDNQTLTTYSIANPDQPAYMDKTQMDVGVETIFKDGNYLYIGSVLGMYIYDISISPGKPVLLSSYTHIVSCDPVVVRNDYAYVTLSAGGEPCWRGVNELQIVDVHDKKNPKQIYSYPMDGPKGLGYSDTLLFVCDNKLSMFSIADPKKVVPIETYPLTAYDVIVRDSILIVTAPDGLYQFTFDDGHFLLLSKVYIPFETK